MADGTGHRWPAPSNPPNSRHWQIRSFPEMARAHAASGADMVTVAVRRVNLTDKSKESLIDFIDRDKLFILPTPPPVTPADEAIRTARLGRESAFPTGSNSKSSAISKTLFPDTEQLIEATKVLVKEGFVVLPYTNDDLIAALKLIDAGGRRCYASSRPYWLRPRHPKSLQSPHSPRNASPTSDDRRPAGVGTASSTPPLAMESAADGSS